MQNPEIKNHVSPSVLMEMEDSKTKQERVGQASFSLSALHSQISRKAWKTLMPHGKLTVFFC
jgi:hypothetical protein